MSDYLVKRKGNGLDKSGGTNNKVNDFKVINISTLENILDNQVCVVIFYRFIKINFGFIKLFIID